MWRLRRRQWYVWVNAHAPLLVPPPHEQHKNALHHESIQIAIDFTWIRHNNVGVRNAIEWQRAAELSICVWHRVDVRERAHYSKQITLHKLNLLEVAINVSRENVRRYISRIKSIENGEDWNFQLISVWVRVERKCANPWNYNFVEWHNEWQLYTTITFCSSIPIEPALAGVVSAAIDPLARFLCSNNCTKRFAVISIFPSKLEQTRRFTYSCWCLHLDARMHYGYGTMFALKPAKKNADFYSCK